MIGAAREPRHRIGGIGADSSVSDSIECLLGQPKVPDQ